MKDKAISNTMVSIYLNAYFCFWFFNSSFQIIQDTHTKIYQVLKWDFHSKYLQRTIMQFYNHLWIIIIIIIFNIRGQCCYQSKRSSLLRSTCSHLWYWGTRNVHHATRLFEVKFRSIRIIEIIFWNYLFLFASIRTDDCRAWWHFYWLSRDERDANKAQIP